MFMKNWIKRCLFCVKPFNIHTYKHSSKYSWNVDYEKPWVLFLKSINSIFHKVWNLVSKDGTLILSTVFKKVRIYLRLRGRGGGVRWEIFTCWFSPKWPQWPVLGQTKIRRLPQVSYMGAGTQALGQPPLLSWAHFQGASSKVDQQKLKLGPIWRPNN